jgi:hypothetical protein
VTADLTPPLALSVDGPATLSTTNGQYSPNPFSVVATVLNNGTAPANNVQLTLNLTGTAGLSLTAGSPSLTQSLGDLPVGAEQQVSWNVQAATQSVTTTIAYAVVASASNAPRKSVVRQIAIPPLATPVQVSITDAQGQPVNALGLNAEGWPTLNAATGGCVRRFAGPPSTDGLY